MLLDAPLVPLFLAFPNICTHVSRIILLHLRTVPRISSKLPLRTFARFARVLIVACMAPRPVSLQLISAIPSCANQFETSISASITSLSELTTGILPWTPLKLVNICVPIARLGIYSKSLSSGTRPKRAPAFDCKPTNIISTIKRSVLITQYITTCKLLYNTNILTKDHANYAECLQTSFADREQRESAQRGREFALSSQRNCWTEIKILLVINSSLQPSPH